MNIILVKQCPADRAEVVPLSSVHVQLDHSGPLRKIQSSPAGMIDPLHQRSDG